MTQFHDDKIGGGHFGFLKTMAKIKSRFSWSHMAKDIQHFCKSCVVCQLRNVASRTEGPMENIPMPSKKWELVGMDIVGPLPKSWAGNCYLLVVVDHLTRYPEVVAMADQEAKTVVCAFLEKIVARWGVPTTIITDQGANFRSALMQEFYRQLGCQTKVSTPYHPQTNGLVERYNRTLKDSLAKLGLRSQADWESNVDWAVGNYRFCRQETLGDSPFFLMTGQDPTLPSDVVYRTGLEDAPVTDLEEWKVAQFERMKESRELLFENMARVQRRNKDRHDDENADRAREFPVGSLVKMISKARTPGVAKKLANRHEGPYRVIALSEKSGNVVTIDLGHGVTKTVNVSLLTPYVVRRFEWGVS